MKAKENICSLWLHFSSLAFKRVFLPLDRKMPQEHQPTHYPQHIFSTSGFWKSTNVELEMSTVKMAQQARSLSSHSTASASFASRCQERRGSARGPDTDIPPEAGKLQWRLLVTVTRGIAVY